MTAWQEFRAAADRLADWVAAMDLEEDEHGYGPERRELLQGYLDARPSAYNEQKDTP